MTTSTRPAPREPERSAPPAAEAPDGLTRRGALAGAAGAAALVATAAVATPSASAASASARRSARSRVAATATATLPSARAVLADGRDLVDHEMVEFAALLRSGATSSVEMTQAYLDRITTFNGTFETYGDNYGYNAFVRIDAASALAQAKAADARIAAERAGGPAAPWLCGMPFGIKDSIAVKGFAAQDGTIDFQGNVATDDAVAVSLLRAQGVVLVGMTICSAYSSSIIGGFAGNAWDYTRVTGGSSQGSGVAAVARLVAGTLGEETGGSIQIPSSINGATGIKPSTGAVPAHGLMPLTPGVDVVGPIVKSARDAALTFNAIAKSDPRDPQTYQVQRPFSVPLDPRPGSTPLAGLTIGVPKQDWTTASTTADPQSTYQADFLTVFNRVRSELTALGARVVDFTWINNHTVAQDPFFSSTTSVGTIPSGTTTAAVSASTALTYANRAEERYIEAVAAFANTRGAQQRAALLAQFGTSGSFETRAALYRAVTQGMRNEAEARRRQLVWHCEKAMADAGVDFMLVMNTPSAPTTTTIPIYRANYQLPNQIGWPMINFPAGSVTPAGSTLPLPASVAFWGPRLSEPDIVQAVIDYQAAHPQWHTARPADPWDASTAAKRREGLATPRISDADRAELQRKADDPQYSTDIAVSKER